MLRMLGVACKPCTRSLCHNSTTKGRRGIAVRRWCHMEATTQLSEYAQRQLPEGIIDFAAGQPGPSLLPLSQIAAAAADRLTGAKADPFILQYAPEQGYASFRACLADFLTTETGHTSHPDELLITAGVSHGLDLACRHLASPGDDILVEQPTYFLAGSILAQAGLKAVPVPTGPQGLDVAALRTLLQQPGGPRPKLCYTIPVHNNPTGVTLPEHQRVELLRLAHQYGFLVVADEVYQLLSFLDAPAPPPPMRAIERSMLQQGLLPNAQQQQPAGPAAPPTPPAPAAAGGQASSSSGSVSTPYSSRVVSLGSFSKIMAPGLRLGWIDAAPPLLQKLVRDGVLGSGGSIAPLASGIAHSCLELGLLQQHLHQVIRPTLQRNCRALCETLRQELPAGCSFSQPQGGYFVWITLPDEICSQDMLAFAAKEFKVKYTPGRVCDGQAHMLRVSFAFYKEHELQEGAKRLAAAIKAYTAAGKQR